MNIVASIKDSMLETLWPTRCVICDKQGELLCKKCMTKIKFIDLNSACKICGEPYGINQCCGCSPVHANIAEDKRDSYKMEFDRCISATILDENSGRIVAIHKDGGERRLAHIMAYFMCQYVLANEVCISDDRCETFVTYIPSTQNAINKRGFDHSLELAKIVASKLGLICVATLCPPDTKDQRKLNRQMRAKNMEGMFKIKQTIDNKIRDRAMKCNLILVDDVLTTGATLNAASKCLHEAGYNKITCLTFARTF